MLLRKGHGLIMVNFIIVDDEPLALDNFAHLLPWEQYGFRCAGTASNGKEALRLLRKHKVDIVFTDIRMPVMDGLSLCRQIKEDFPLVKMVILTAYKDFDYAKMAVSFGVQEYLLKNQVEPDTVRDILSRLRNRIEEERDRKMTEKRHYYQNMMLNIMTDKEMIFEKEGTGYCMLIRRRAPFIEEILGENTMEPISISFEAIQELLSFQNTLELIQVVWVDNESWGLLLSVPEGAPLKEMDTASCMREVCQRIKGYFQDVYKEEIFALFGQCGESPEQVKNTLKEMRSCSDYCIFIKRIPYCDYHIMKNIFRNSISDHQLLKELIHEAGEALKKCEMEKMEEAFDKIYRDFSIPTYDLGKFRYCCRKLLEQIDWLWQHNNIDFIKDKLPDTGMYYAEELWKWIKGQYKNIAKLNAAPQKTSPNRKIAQALEYIHANYSNKITVWEVSGQVGLSEVYFSNLFKKEVGATFGEYLTSYRMGIAKHLIQYGDYRIYEIAEKVGYSSAQYFSQIFMKETGRTPMEYKNNGDI